MPFENSIIETMRNRQSIRTFETEQVHDSISKQIIDYINDEQNLMNPFGAKGRIVLIQVTNNVTDKGLKLGTYGFIKNPQAYLVGITKNDKNSLIGFGYTFHKLVLYLTQIGLGTCWIGGTFNRKTFERELSIGKNEFIPCITPIGFPREKQRIFDKALRYVVKADNKKPWENLFYDTNFEKSLTKANAAHLEIPIEMVRLGPSASNKQPWRVVFSNDRRTCHFFIEHTPNYSSKLGYDMQLLDMGIAMCQFDVACKELNIDGEWLIDDPKLNLSNEHVEYLFSWKSS